MKIKKDLSQDDVHSIAIKDKKIKKYLENINIIKTIFVKNKIINYIVK